MTPFIPPINMPHRIVTTPPDLARVLRENQAMNGGTLFQGNWASVTTQSSIFGVLTHAIGGAVVGGVCGVGNVLSAIGGALTRKCACPTQPSRRAK